MKTRKLLSILLTLAMLASLVPFAAVPAMAALNSNEYVTYVIGDGYNSPEEAAKAGHATVATASGPVETVESHTGSATVEWSDGWYVVTGDNISIERTVTVSGTVNLILADGAHLTVNRGIIVPVGATLNIYAQDGSNGAIGQLTATGHSSTSGNSSSTGGGAGIGGSRGVSCGTINIYGGVINATGSYFANNNATHGGAAGIGGGAPSSNTGNGGAGGTVTIYGGTVNATGGASESGNYGGAGIGGAGGSSNHGGAGGSFTMYGGTVTATGGTNARGIGRGCNGASDISLNYYEAVRTAGNDDTAQIITLTGKHTTPTTAVFTATGEDSGKLTGLTAGVQYLISGAGITNETTVTAVADGNDGVYVIGSDLEAGTLYVKRAGDANHEASDAQQLTVASQAAPTPTANSCSFPGESDGSIIGLGSNQQHQYRPSTTDEWSSPFTGSLNNLGEGTYYVRKAPHENYLASPAVEKTITARAVHDVSYRYYDESSKEFKTGTHDAYLVVSSSSSSGTQWGVDDNSTWYYVTGPDVTISSYITNNSRNVHLILADGATLNATKGIHVQTGSLTIYGQDAGTGVLNATGASGDAGIGGWSSSNYKDCGAVTIHGGVINATGGANAAGIGGGYASTGGNGGTVTILGGTVNANGGSAYVVGIGAGKDGGSNGTLTLGDNITLYGIHDDIPAGHLLVRGPIDNVTDRLQNMATHIHDISYTLSSAEDAITATCANADGCGLTMNEVNSAPVASNTVTVTIVAPERTVFGDTTKSAAATLTGIDYDDTEINFLVSSISYYYATDNDTRTGEALGTAPESAGKYWAEFTLGDKTAHVVYTIAKANQAAPAAPEMASCTSTSITLTPVEGFEYQRGTEGWQESNTFTGLTPGVEYTFYQRKAATGNYNESPSSDPAQISTLAHVHNYATYSVSGDTITAYCTGNDCDLPNNTATLQIVAPALTTFGGTESAEATLEDAYGIHGDAEIEYYEGNAKLPGAPTDAGSYRAKITVGGVTASVPYTIEKADYPTADIPAVTMADYEYGQPATPSIPDNFTGKTDGTTVSFYYNTSNDTATGTAWDISNPPTLSAGDYYMYAVVDGMDNYKGFTTAADSFTVGKSSVGTLAVTIADYTYGGTVSTPTIEADYPGKGSVIVSYYYTDTASSTPSGGTP